MSGSLRRGETVSHEEHDASPHAEVPRRRTRLIRRSTSTLVTSGAITALSTKTVKWSTEATSEPHRRRSGSGLLTASDTCGHGGRRSLDLDQRATTGTGIRGDVANVRELRAISHSDRKSQSRCGEACPLRTSRSETSYGRSHTVRSSSRKP